MRRRSRCSPRTEVDASPPANSNDSNAEDNEEGTNDHGASVISDTGTQCYVEYEHKAVNTDGQNEVVALATALEETTVSLKESKIIEQLQRDNKSLASEICKLKSPAAMMLGDDNQIRFYTGLPSYAIFETLLKLFSGVIPTASTGCGLGCSDQLLLVLMKLRLAVPNQDLGYRFRIHATKVSKVFHLWIDTMARELTQPIDHLARSRLYL